MSQYETILYEAGEGMATVTLNRPESLNGITNTMMRELYDCLSAAADDDSTRVLVFTGAGKAFCPGVDIRARTSGGEQEPLRPEYFMITAMLHEMPKVTIAAINGACAGAGFGWAAACDLRYAAESANLNSAFLDVAISGDMAGPWTLPRIVGASKARELYFLPGKFPATEAERIGLVSKTFPDGSFREEVDAVARRIARSAPLTVKEMKANFVSAERLSLRDYIHIETERHRRTGATHDSQEAFRAFIEKREPQFRGE